MAFDLSRDYRHTLRRRGAHSFLLKLLLTVLLSALLAVRNFLEPAKPLPGFHGPNRLI
jgi:hypothetical protein